MSRSRRIAWIGLLAGTGSILFVLEGYVPRPLPWVKLGLSNVASLVALLLCGGPDAFGVMAIRLFIGGLFTGSLLSPAFLLAAGGGLTGLGAMGAVHRLWPRRFSPVGISLFGALGHNVAQLSLAYLLFVRQVEIFYLLPMFLLTSVVTGSLTGLLAYWAVERLQTGQSAGSGQQSAQRVWEYGSMGVSFTTGTGHTPILPHPQTPTPPDPHTIES